MKVRGDIIRTYQTLHSWTGIITGLILFIAFYAGSLTMFKPAIEQWAAPVSNLVKPVPTKQIDKLIAQAVDSSEKAKAGFIVNINNEESSLSWYAKGGGRGLRLDDELIHASFNEEQQIVTDHALKNELGSLIDQLHRTAGIIGKVGHEDLGVLILGLAAGLYFIALISGVIFLLPTLVKSLFSLRTHKGASRFWLDSHNLIGVVSLPFHFIIAWTAVVFALHDPFYGGLSVVYGDKPMFERNAPAKTIYNPETLPKMQQYLDKVAEVAPQYKVVKLDFSRLTQVGPSVAIEVHASGQMMRGGYSDIIYMHPYTLEVANSTVYDKNSSNYGPIVKSFFGLHFGNFAGNFGRWVYFALGLLGAFLFYSGNLLWIEKRRKKQGQQTQSTRVLAALTVGVCLGSVLGTVSSLVANKWLYIFTQQINSYYLYCYYGVFFVAIGYCLKRGAALGAIHILWALVLACIAIPLTSAISLFTQADIMVTYAYQANYAIELCALIFSVLFTVAANKTRKRALTGEKNSVWFVGETSNQQAIKVSNTTTNTVTDTVTN